MKVSIMTSRYDTWISEELLLSLAREGLTWFKEECGLSREDLVQILVRANEIVRELRPTDILELTYDTGGGWYVNGSRSYPEGRLHFDCYREDHTITQQQADMAVVK